MYTLNSDSEHRLRQLIRKSYSVSFPKKIIMASTLLTIIYAIFVLLCIWVWRYMAKRRAYLNSLGLPIHEPFLCFGSPPFALHKLVRHEYWHACFKKYGETFANYSGSWPCIVTIDPELIKEVLVKNFEAFGESFSPKIDEKHMSLDKSAGPIWKAMRKLLSPTFTTGKLKTMLEPVEDVTDRTIAYIETMSTEGKVLSVKDIWQSFTLDTIAKCAFGIHIDSHKDTSHPLIADAKKTFSDFRCTNWLMSLFIAAWEHCPALFDRFVMPKAMDTLYDTTEAIIKHRQANNIKIDDFVGRLTELHTAGPEPPITPVLVAAQGVIFFAAGFETTASTLTTLSYNLAKHPEIQERICQEILDLDGVITHETINNMPYLEATIMENMRMCPPITWFIRVATKDTTLRGMSIKKGTRIAMPTYNLHHWPEFHPEPEVFRPERFLKENEHKLIPYTVNPFGGGPRVCIGQRFAMVEMKICIAKLLQKFRLVATPETELVCVPGDLFLFGVKDVKVKFVQR